MNTNYDSKKVFIEVFQKQKEVLENAYKFYKKLEKDASESDKREMAHNSPLLERIDDLVNGEPEMPLHTIETALETINEYLKALDHFSEDQFGAFMMGVGVNWINIPYWGISGLEFQCKKIEEWMNTYKDLESNTHERNEKRHPVIALPIYCHSEKLLYSEILASMLFLYKNMLQVLSSRSF